MFLKDPRTGSKSVTVTMLVVTFILACLAQVVNIFCMYYGLTVYPSLVWSGIGLMSPFVAVYWNKRIRASASGVSFGGENESSDFNKNDDNENSQE